MPSKATPSVAFVAVGSNVEPERNIVAALGVLLTRTRVASCSIFYRTAPVGPPGQPAFINGTWQIDTVMSPMEIRNELLRPTEAELGRIRTPDRFAPRTIDLDLVLYNDLVMDDDVFRLPHPDLTHPFVCVPVLELLNGAEAMESSLRSRMLRLVPPVSADVKPGEPLHELTMQMRTMLASEVHTHPARTRGLSFLE
jgi:2-amino-4-hydroxy-6-hydroxymethyldihydropteridine diphosphokinase